MPRRSPCSRQAAGVARSEAGGRGAGGRDVRPVRRCRETCGETLSNSPLKGER